MLNTTDVLMQVQQLYHMQYFGVEWWYYQRWICVRQGAYGKLLYILLNIAMNLKLI